MIENGKFYALGRSKANGDRSFLGSIWEVIEHTETHAVCVCITKHYIWNDKEPRLFLIEEFNWTPAEKLVEALTNYRGK